MGERTALLGQCACMRLHGNLIVNYLLRAVGSSSTVPKLVHKDPPRPFDKVFYLYDPDAFFRSYRTCIEIIHQMLAQTPVVGEFDLAVDNWDEFLPHRLATSIVGGYRDATDQNMGVAPPYGTVDVLVTVRVNAVYSEPKALLLACKQVTAAHCRFMAAARGVNAGTSECCVCMENLAAHEVDGPDALMLPCSHDFHARCLLPWFHRQSTCPMCRRDMITYLVAATKTPKGKFPGQEARVDTPSIN
ncbi:E3 ubiquitin-protein ligase SGR9, amyloplastic-like [Aegilops tauschii subsp. strangulata]|uniref:E3 ubiquitin-protein ligase SGR9, amyloplastic-like n=1 Tax=Aegilops tauschii subsp. strangulata TaxID=200361 RepID=UPI00098AE7DB|nr:E3 ubiquitin-protein ligase SGR9, amyloplastic-like [Aegilops tauschii subsp. strangulata]